MEVAREVGAGLVEAEMVAGEVVARAAVQAVEAVGR